MLGLLKTGRRGVRRGTEIYGTSWTPLFNAETGPYFWGTAFSLLGAWMQSAAQGWLVWTLTHSARSMGIVGLLLGIPAFLVTPLAGVWGDRGFRRTILIASQLIGMLAALVMGLLLLSGKVALWQVYGLIVVVGSVAAMETATSRAFLCDLCGTEQLREALAVQTGINQLARTLGPVAAGVLIVHSSMATVFFFNSLSFAAALLALWAVRHIVQIPLRGEDILGELMEAGKWLWRPGPAVTLIGLSLAMSALGTATYALYAPLVAVYFGGGSVAYARLLSAYGAGALAGVVVLVPLAAEVKRTGRLLLMVTALGGACYSLLGISVYFALAWAFIFVAGAMAPIVNTAVGTAIQTIAPEPLRGRVVAFWIMAVQGGSAVGTLTLGALADHWGVVAVLVVDGGVLVSMTVGLAIFLPQFLAWQESNVMRWSKN